MISLGPISIPIAQGTSNWSIPLGTVGFPPPPPHTPSPLLKKSCWFFLFCLFVYLFSQFFKYILWCQKIQNLECSRIVLCIHVVCPCQVYFIILSSLYLSCEGHTTTHYDDICQLFNIKSEFNHTKSEFNHTDNSPCSTSKQKWNTAVILDL